jgi:hypothetical protein
MRAIISQRNNLRCSGLLFFAFAAAVEIVICAAEASASRQLSWMMLFTALGSFCLTWSYSSNLEHEGSDRLHLDAHRWGKKIVTGGKHSK